jgi:WD40 repeat protein
MRIFLSFNAKDQLVAESFREALVRLDPALDIFFAPVTTLGQGFWLPKLAQEINSRDAFLLLLGPSGVGRWQEIEYHEAFFRHGQEPGFALAPVIVAGAKVPGLPFLRDLNWTEIPAAFGNEALHRVMAALSGAPGQGVSRLWQLVHPYRGLEAMTEVNADYFFGRGAETEAALKVLADKPSRLPILIGASGVGKSSVAQAGVLSALKAMRWPSGSSGERPPWPAAFEDSRTGWAWLVMRPGEDPMQALASAFTRLWFKDLTDPERGPTARKWADGLRKDNSLADLIQATQDKLEHDDGAKPNRILLYLDQLEELYTGSARAAPRDAARFSQVLADGLKDPRLIAFASLRSDYFGRLQADAPLWSVHELVNVPPLTRTALDEVVTGPAQALKVKFEDEKLPGRIVEAAAEDAAKARGALPLLSYLLTDMWSKMVERDDGVLRLPAHAIDIGGVLAATAEKFLQIKPDAENSLKRLLTLRLALVPPEGDPVRRQALQSECSPEEWSLAEQLAEYPWRLVVTGEREPEEGSAGGEVTAEVAHEALLKAWPRLAQWLHDQRDFLVFKGEAERQERRWRTTNRLDRALLGGLDLDRAVEWLSKRAEDLSSDVRDFIQASIACDRTAKEKQIRFQRRVSVGAAIAAVVLAGLLGAAGYFWLQANAAKRDAVVAEDQAVVARNQAEASLAVANARAELRDGRIESAIVFADTAFKKVSDETSRSALASALFEVSPHLLAKFNVDAPTALTWSDGDTVAFAPTKAATAVRMLALSKHGLIGAAKDWPLPRLTRVQDGNPASLRTFKQIGADRMIAVFDTGAVAVIARGATAAQVWMPSAPRTQTGAESAAPITLQIGAHSAAISRSGGLIATANNGSDATIVECKSTEKPTAPLGCEARSLPGVHARAVTISPDEKRVAVGDESGAVTLYDRTGKRIGDPIQTGAPVLALDWAKARDWLAVGGTNGSVVVIDLGASGTPQIATHPGGGGTATLRWSPEGLNLVFSCKSAVCLWLGPAEPGAGTNFAPIRRFEGHANSVAQLAWSADGKNIASADDTLICVWILAQNTDAGMTLYAEAAAQITKVATSPDGGRLAGGATDGTIRIWDSASGSLLRTVKSTNGAAIESLAWGRSGLLAAAHETDGITVVPATIQQSVREIPAQTGLEARIVFAEDDKTVALAKHDDKTIALIDITANDGRSRGSLDAVGDDRVPWGITVDPPGTTLFATYTPSAKKPTEIYLWNIAEQKRLGTMAYTLKEERDPAAGGSLSVSRDGRWLATSGGDKYIRIYNIRTRASWKALPMDSNFEPDSVAFSPDGTKLAALADDRVYVWSVRENGVERYVVFKGAPSKSRTVDGELGKAMWLDWVTNDSIALVAGNSAIQLIGLDAVKWRRRTDSLRPVTISPEN